MKGSFYYLDHQSVPFDLIHTTPNHYYLMFSVKSESYTCVTWKNICAFNFKYTTVMYIVFLIKISDIPVNQFFGVFLFAVSWSHSYVF